MKKLLAGAAMAAATVTMAPQAAFAGPDPYLGEVMMVPYTFCPRGTLEASGQLLPISQYTALFSLMGTTYGGDGRTTFAVPDLRGRVPMGQGRGPGLSDRRMGERAGRETNTLNVAQIPSHSHTATLKSGGPINTPNPSGALLADYTGSVPAAYNNGSATASMSSQAIEVANTGGSQPINNLQPYTVMRYCIATQGTFPSRN